MINVVLCGTGSLSSMQSLPDVASLRHGWANDFWGPDWTWTWRRTPHTCTAPGVPRTRAAAIVKNLVILKPTLAHGPFVALLLFLLIVHTRTGRDKRRWRPIKRRGHKHVFFPLPMLRIRIRRIRVFSGLPDPDPLIRGKDPDPPTVFWLLYDFSSSKNYVNVASKSTYGSKQKELRKNNNFFLPYWKSLTRTAGSGAGSESDSQRYGSADPDTYQNVTDPQHQGFGSGSVSGSGSAWIRINLSCWIRIRIQIADPDPDPGGQKWPTKMEKSTEFSYSEVLDVLFWGLKASPVAWASFMEA